MILEINPPLVEKLLCVIFAGEQHLVDYSSCMERGGGKRINERHILI
jgi:hypothetical protein